MVWAYAGFIPIAILWTKLVYNKLFIGESGGKKVRVLR